ncbi:MAG: CvpA family protein [Rhodospirillaceae bacterium]|nr:CvpA family protein [Rhodospirillaceae bacterium]
MNPADIAVIAIILLSGLLAFFRGFVREALSIAGWIGAAYVAVLAFPQVRPWVGQYVSSDLAADGITLGAVFIVALIVFGIVGNLIARLVRGTTLSAVDRSLGFLFGLLRGVVLVSLAYLVVTWLFPPEQEPAWLREAHSRPWVERGADMLVALVPEDLLAEGLGEAQREIGDRLRDDASPSQTIDLRELARPQPAQPDTPETEGYQDDQTDDLDRMIENLQNQDQ